VSGASNGGDVSSTPSVLGDQAITAAERARDAADRVLACPWWRPFRRAALVQDMRQKRLEMKQAHAAWRRATYGI